MSIDKYIGARIFTQDMVDNVLKSLSFQPSRNDSYTYEPTKIKVKYGTRYLSFMDAIDNDRGGIK